MSVSVVRPGLLTTVQDAGRHGLQHLGVVPCGPMDAVAHAIANALVGNAVGEAALEVTVLGPELLFESDALVALCGAQMDARAGGLPMPLDRPVLVEAGSRLILRRTLLGSRAYLAVAGGFAVPEVLGSRSTYLPARFGGHEGRALRAGDRLALAPQADALARRRYAGLPNRRSSRGVATVGWSVPALTLPEREPVVLHAMEGRHYGMFDAAAKRAFFDATWKVTPDSNRMGYRFAGPALAREDAREILSEPTCLGTVQVPSGGAPIALMVDHQTTGGYPKIAEIAAADVPRLAQLAPGGSAQFARCTLEQANELRGALRKRVDAALRSLDWTYGGRKTA